VPKPSKVGPPIHKSENLLCARVNCIVRAGTQPVIFSVWAPRANKSVELVCGEERFPMLVDTEGVWRVDCEPNGIASGYRYSIDSGPAVPDPRSRWQPDGVHGASFLVSETALKAITRREFTAKPLGEGVIYELHVGTFTIEGTYTAAIAKLPHLVRLGVTHLELMPLATFPGNHGWGYDGVFLFAPHPAYGTPEELANFIAASHAQGLAVLLDVVYNHLGPDGNYLSHYAPYFTDRVKTAWGDAVNYDGEHSDGVRHFVIDNARMWLDVYGFDGLRLDAVHAISSFEAVHVLEDLAIAVQELADSTKRSLTLIAESDLNDPHLVYPRDRGGYGLAAHWVDDFHHALHRLFTGEKNGYYADFNGIVDMATALREGYVYQGQYSVHRKRRHGRAPRGVTPSQLVVSAQNHDQIGNRANGERLSMLLKPVQLKAVAALTILSPFVPLLFQGEEWGASTPFLYFTDHQDVKLGQLVAEGRRREFQSFGWRIEVPDPQATDTFLRSQLSWGELAEAVHKDLFDWYQALIALRVSTANNAASTPSVRHNESGSSLSVSTGKRLIVINLTEQSQSIAVPADHSTMVLSSVEHGSQRAFEPFETRIFRLSN
jgi:maltooligosyltrehalose trehalohydrolase